MDARTLSRLALQHARNAASEELYLATGLDLSRPTTFRASINERCNYKCRYCKFWRLEQYADELSIEQWKQALLSIKAFVGHYSIEFVGGEPFIKKGFVDLLRFCSENDISAGVITNGSCFNPRMAQATVSAKPFKIDISVDAADAAVHDYVRGAPGSLKAICAAIQRLRDERDRQGHRFPIRIKPTIHSRNFTLLPRLVDWAKAVGATSVDFEPVRPWTAEVETELWIEAEQQAEFQEVIQTLIRMKQAGDPIENSVESLSSFAAHFRREAIAPAIETCRVGLRDFHIRTNGDVEVCWFMPPIGNVTRQSAREIWRSAAARERRERTTACTKGCAVSCLAHKPFVQKVKKGVMMLRRQGSAKRSISLSGLILRPKPSLHRS